MLNETKTAFYLHSFSVFQNSTKLSIRLFPALWYCYYHRQNVMIAYPELPLDSQSNDWDVCYFIANCGAYIFTWDAIFAPLPFNTEGAAAIYVLLSSLLMSWAHFWNYISYHRITSFCLIFLFKISYSHETFWCRFVFHCVGLFLAKNFRKKEKSSIVKLAFYLVL